jgi:hypothetical protein
VEKGNEMFYFLRQNLFEPLDIFDYEVPKSEKDISLWLRGERIDKKIERLVCPILENTGSEFADFFDVAIPIMSKKLIVQLNELGVTNFDKTEVVFKNKITGEEFIDYSAVNFIGSYACVDLNNSVHRMRFGKPYFTGSMVIDPKKVGDLEIFRLKVGPSFLVVTERIAKSLSKQSYRALLIQPISQYSGT